jgi:hypothetical protein
MTFRKSILLLFSVSMITALLACGSSSNSTTPPPPPPPPVTGPLPDGNYVFSLIGDDAASGQYSVAGVFTVSQGSITAGEQDFVDFPNTAYSDQINSTGSSVTASADGNLIITLATCNGTTCTGSNNTDTKVGVSGTETFDASVLPNNAARAFITEYDASATSSGELDLQTSATLPTPPIGYAFIVTGVDSGFCQTALGGVLNITSATAISGANSVFDANDCGGSPSVPGALLSNQTFGASTISGPDTFGRLVFGLVPTATLTQINLVGYIVSQNQIDLVETTDGNANLGTTSGIAYSQGPNTDTFNTASASGNTYVVGLNGGDSVGTLQAVAQVTANADTSASGFIDFNDLSTVEPASPDPISAAATAYVVDPTGRVTITGLADGAVPPNVFNIQLYLDGSGHALAISLDSNNYLAGVGYQQSGAGSFAFNGTYAMGATGWDAGFEGELDAVGPVTAVGTGGTFSGDVDLNWLDSTAGPVYPDALVAGAFTSNADGIFTGTITGVDVTTCPLFTTTAEGPCTADVFNYYLIDAAGDNIAIETDLNQLTLGAFTQQ